MPSPGPVGIIGFGVFGKFMAEQLAPHVPVLVSTRSATAAEVVSTGARRVELAKAAACPVVVPSVPVQFLQRVLEEMAAYVQPGALVADVSSVKKVPVELMLRILPAHCDILATHPLFGPQSGSGGIAGLPMVVWPVRLPDERYRRLKEFLVGTLKLDVTEVSPEEHDREMAYVQALTFFLGKALSDIGIPDTPLKTKTYQHLLDVKRIVEADTPELFETIQHYNPYAGEVRELFTKHLDGIEVGLAEGRTATSR